jgi:hypothetical protein
MWCLSLFDDGSNAGVGFALRKEGVQIWFTSLLVCKMHVVNVLPVGGYCLGLQLHTPRKYAFALLGDSLT